MKFIITKLLVLSYRYKEHALSVDNCRIKPVTSGSRTVIFFTANSGFRFFVLTKMTVASCPARLAGAVAGAALAVSAAGRVPALINRLFAVRPPPALRTVTLSAAIGAVAAAQHRAHPCNSPHAVRKVFADFAVFE